MRAQVITREKIGASRWVRFGVDVTNVYKRPTDWPTSRYTPDVVWVPESDLVCRCPKLRRHRTYLLVGRTSSEVPAGSSGSGSGRTLAGLVVDRECVAMRWNEASSRRIKRLARSRRC